MKYILLIAATLICACSGPPSREECEGWALNSEWARMPRSCDQYFRPAPIMNPRKRK